MEHNMKKINIMGVRIDNVTMDEVMGTIEDKISKSEQYVIYTPNTEFIMMCREDDEFKDYMNSSDINIPDGIGLIYAAKIKNHPLKEKVAGFDLSVKMLELADRKGFKLFAIGGKPGVAQSAMEKVHENYPGIKIA
jgi:N-acetylglucosaminyldiphosphoundecaprenol N-acetyl-beta-D-mannosaminyltransferase